MGYDTVLLGQAEPAKFDVNQIQQRLSRPGFSAIEASLGTAGFLSVLDIMATYAGQAVDLSPWLKDAEINHDRNLRLQYLAGMGLNLYQSDSIYKDLLRYRRFPEDLFIAPDDWKKALRAAIMQPRSE
jgi:spermidine synthase